MLSSLAQRCHQSLHYKSVYMNDLVYNITSIHIRIDLKYRYVTMNRTLCWLPMHRYTKYIICIPAKGNRYHYSMRLNRIPSISRRRNSGGGERWEFTDILLLSPGSGKIYHKCALTNTYIRIICQYS